MIPKTLQEARGRDWFWLEGRLVDEGWVERMGTDAWAIYTCIAYLSSDKIRPFPSTAELEKLTGVSQLAVKAAFHKLYRLKLLGRIRKGAQRHASAYGLLALPAVPEGYKRKKPAPKKMEPIIDYELELFEEAWAAYPRKAGCSKEDALTQWKKRRSEGNAGAAMLVGVRAYAAFIEHHQVEMRFTKLTETFLGPKRHFLSDWSVSGQESERGIKSSAADDVAAWNANEEVV